MKLAIFVLLLSIHAFANEETGTWFCEQTSSKREGNVLWVCGMGDSTSEGGARMEALKNALDQFNIICKASSDCGFHPRTIDPQRTSCKKDPRGFFSCVRLIVVTLEN